MNTKNKERKVNYKTCKRCNDQKKTDKYGLCKSCQEQIENEYYTLYGIREMEH